MSSPLSSAAVNPEANAADVSRKELQDKLNGLGGLSGRKLDPEARAKKLREACEGFESIFIQKMWQEMRNAVPKGGLLQGREEKFWQDMYDQELSKSMTKAGGIGLADMMYEQLSRNLVSASRSTAGSGIAGAFVPGAAPLVGSGLEESVLDETPQVEAQSIEKAAATPMGGIYDGEAPQVADAQEESAPMQAAQAVVPASAPVTAPIQQERQLAQAAPQQGPVVEEIENSRPKRAPRTKKAGTDSRNYENNGLNLAYLARREAGDKLGSGAVRPPLYHKREDTANKVQHEAVQTQNALITQSGQFVPGSTAGLQAALELARSGRPDGVEKKQPDLQHLVASLQAQNNAASVQNAANAPVESDQGVEPATRKVRYTTNIPRQTKNRKKGDQAIRMLNVDNVGVNSKQGQGLAAYHASQEAAAASKAQPVNAQTQTSGQPAPIAPLTAASAQERETTDANFAIPPLRADGLKG